MRFRKLRIAWSVGWGLAAVLLIVLWVRSYTRQEDAGGKFARIVLSVASVRARVVSQFGLVPPLEGGLSFNANSELTSNTEVYDADLSEVTNKLGFGFFQFPLPTVIFPHWFAALLTATLAVMPWIRWTNRFSLRTLLIATTLVAVMLGWIVWAAK
jgi:hypothetical protein